MAQQENYIEGRSRAAAEARLEQEEAQVLYSSPMKSSGGTHPLSPRDASGNPFAERSRTVRLEVEDEDAEF